MIYVARNIASYTQFYKEVYLAFHVTAALVYGLLILYSSPYLHSWV